MLRIDRFHAIDGTPLRGFFVRDKANKVLAIGATSSATSEGYVMPSRKRYARDVELCRAIWKLTGVPMKWNLTFHGRHVTSHNNQDLMRTVRRCADPRCNHRN